MHACEAAGLRILLHRVQLQGGCPWQGVDGILPTNLASRRAVPDVPRASLCSMLPAFHGLRAAAHLKDSLLRHGTWVST